MLGDWLAKNWAHVASLSVAIGALVTLYLAVQRNRREQERHPAALSDDMATLHERVRTLSVQKVELEHAVADAEKRLKLLRERQDLNLQIVSCHSTLISQVGRHLVEKAQRELGELLGEVAPRRDLGPPEVAAHHRVVIERVTSYVQSARVRVARDFLVMYLAAKWTAFAAARFAEDPDHDPHLLFHEFRKLLGPKLGTLLESENLDGVVPVSLAEALELMEKAESDFETVLRDALAGSGLSMLSPFATSGLESKGK